MGIGEGTYGPSVVAAGNDCETFWDKDQLTDSCYQFNFQSTLSWREAWASCEQQGADLLSITEIHEQTYINGLLTGYSSTLWIGLNDLDTSGGWQWSDNSPLKYLNWESGEARGPHGHLAPFYPAVDIESLGFHLPLE